MLVTEKMRHLIVGLHEKGITGASTKQNGCSPAEEELLISMIIQSTLRKELPSLDLIDKEGKLLDLLASYMATRSAQIADEILSYLIEGAVEYYSRDINYLFKTLTRHQPRNLAL